MGQLVSPEITVSAEDLLTLVAFIRLVVGVGQQVGLEVGPLIKASSTDGTLVGRLFHVEDFVDRQCSGLAKPFATFSTLEGLLLGMDVPVVP